MSKKIIIVLFVIIVLAACGWWYLNSSAPVVAPQTVSTATQATQTPSTNTEPAVAPTPGTPNTVIIPASGSSDSSLNQEASEVDTQLNGLVTDTGNADTALNSQ